MKESEASKGNSRFKPWQIVLIVIGALMIIGQLFGGESASTSNSSTAASSTSVTKNVDIMTKRSCRDWYTWTAEGAKGVLTMSEMRNSFKKIYDVAKYSEDLDIADAATRQMAALTSGDVKEFESAAMDFGNACKTHLG